MVLPVALAAKGAMMAARSPAARRMAMSGARAGARRAARDPRVRQMAGRQMARAAQSQRGQQMMRNAARGYQNERRRQMEMRSMAKGGKVRKTGIVYLHKGERVVPVKKVKKVEKGLRNLGINLRLPKSNVTVKVPLRMLSTTQLRNLARIGGKVMKTGPHKVSKGQRVIPAAKVSNVNKILRRK